MNPKTIVCGIDFSPASLRALEAALGLAAPHGSRVVLVHVLDRFPNEAVYSAGRAAQLIAAYRRREERINRDLRALVPANVPYTVEAITATGAPHDVLLATARERHADLIVVGQSARASIDRLMTGATVDTILRRAPCPVLVVAPQSTPRAA